MHNLRGEHEADKLALARERRRSQAVGDAAASRAGRVGQLETSVQLSDERATQAEAALAASRESNRRIAAELMALHSAARDAAEALVPAGASSDPMRMHNERVVQRLFRALENVGGAGEDGASGSLNTYIAPRSGREDAQAASGGTGGEGGGKRAGWGFGEGGGDEEAVDSPEAGAGPVDGGGLLGLTASAREQRTQVQALIETYRKAAVEARARERGVRKRALELRARLQRYGESSAEVRKAVADELARLGEGGEGGDGVW